MLIPVAGTAPLLDTCTVLSPSQLELSAQTTPPLLIDSQTYSETYSEIIHTTPYNIILLLYTTQYRLQ